MRSLAGVSLRTLARSRRRYALTAVGASLGVAVLFAVLVVSAASRNALDEAIGGQTGSADVVISPTGSFDALLPPDTAAMVRSLPDVETVVSTVGTRSSLRTTGDADADPREDIVFVTGIGDGYQRLHELRRLEGRAPAAGAAEIEIPRALATRRGLDVGDRAQLATPDGPVEVEVTGVLADVGAATANQGTVAFASAETVRGFLGAPGATNGVQVDLAPGVETARWMEEHRDVLAGVSVQDAAELASGFRGFIDSINGALTLIAAIALFVGGFLIYLTFSVAVAERTHVLGTMRALGALEKRVRRMVVVEAALLGAVCGLIGLVVGYGLSVLAVGLVGELLDLDLGGGGPPVGAALFSLAVAVLVAMAAAWLPARRAARVDPVSAMRGGALAIERAPRRWLGPLLGAAGLVLAVAAGSVAGRGLGLLALLAGAVLSVHLAIAPLGRLAGVAIRRLSPGTGTIAVRHLEHERSRSSYTLALVMVAFAAVLAVGASNLAMSDSLDTILDRQASAIQVGAPGALDPSVASELSAVDGVGEISPLRFGNTEITVHERGPDGAPASTRRSRSFLQIVDPATYFEVSSLPYVRGDDGSVRAALAAGGAVVVPTPELNRLGAAVGDTVELSTVDGPAPFEIVGSYAVMGGGFGTIASTVDLERLGGGRVNGFLVSTDGTDVEVVTERIRDTVGARHQLIVDSPADSREYATSQLAGFFSLAYAILAVAAIISLLGLANTLVVAVLARTREIGVLRSYGARRRQLRGMVTIEALVMCAIAVVLALPLAALMAGGLISGQRSTLGAEIGFRYPWALIPPFALGALVVAAAAAAVPARRAARLEIVDTLRAE